MTLKVNEIFYSIQGESSFAGIPCVFIRLTGCNLRCSYCDTKYAFYEGNILTINDIITTVLSYQCHLIEITGGEPLIQKQTPDLVYELLEKGFEVLLETNGTQDISLIDERCIKIVDIKCPSSGAYDKVDLNNLNRLQDKDEIKFVIGNRQDYEYARRILDIKNCKSSRENSVLFSPVFNVMDPRMLTKWILDDHLKVRFQVQLHKIIWDSNQRGV